MIKKRARLIGEHILPFVHANDKILDFGCGDMAVAEYISNYIDADFTGIDTVDYQSGRFKFIKFTGGRLPFKDNEFDATFAVFALHHTNSPSFYLSEIARVSNNRIIIIEDTYINIFEKIAAYIVDWIGNHIESWSINIPFNFKSVQEWKRLFNENNLKLSLLKRFYPHPIPFIPTRNVIMVLTK